MVGRRLRTIATVRPGVGVLLLLLRVLAIRVLLLRWVRPQGRSIRRLTAATSTTSLLLILLPDARLVLGVKPRRRRPVGRRLTISTAGRRAIATAPRGGCAVAAIAAAATDSAAARRPRIGGWGAAHRVGHPCRHGAKNENEKAKN